MGSGTKLMATGIAAIAMATVVPPAAAPQVKNPLQFHSKKFFLPDPMIGIRGDATVLRISPRS
jgi:hypothetical protein